MSRAALNSSWGCSRNHPRDTTGVALIARVIGDMVRPDAGGQYLHRTVDDHTLYTTVTRGISLGCPLSPVMAALYLEPLDRRMEATGLTYARFMDDWVVLAPTRWSLRRAVRLVNETLRELRVEQHPDKTFLGRIARGFAFLGYWVTEQGVTGVAPSTWARFRTVWPRSMSRMRRRSTSGDVLGTTSGVGGGGWSVGCGI